MTRNWLFIFVFISFFFSLYSFGIDSHTAPEIISVSEIYLLADTPTAAFFQPATKSSGLAINHCNPFGFTGLNVFSLATQTQQFSAGVIALQQDFISEKTFYAGYVYDIHDIILGGNVRLYHHAVEGYDTITACTGNIGAIWQNSIFTHGVTYSNITQTANKTIQLPSVFKYECAVTPFDKTAFGVSFEKEKDFDIRYAIAVKQEIYEGLHLSTGAVNHPNQLSAGLSVKIKDISVSYAVQTHEYLDYTQAVGVLYRF
ncbi:MAG: hypothetical protein FWG20_06790 [Candidatus Cloacimonetes bacterium]|nr:hypothetical protein [Candidatus Cloacimonadota bacterium]